MKQEQEKNSIYEHHSYKESLSEQDQEIQSLRDQIS